MDELQATELRSFFAANSGAVLLDVREPWEVALAAITLPGSQVVAIPMSEIPEQIDQLKSHETLVCLCHHGVRSAHVARFLVQSGFSNVFNVRGGIDAWSTQVDPQVSRY